MKFRNFVLSKDLVIPSNYDYRRVMLVGYLALISFGAGLFYLVYNLAYGIEDSFFAHYVLFIGCAASFWLNRIGKHYPAKIILLLATNFIVFVFSSQSDYKTDTHFFYLVISVSAFAVLGYENRWLAIGTSAFSVLIFTVSFATGYTPFPDAGYPEYYIRVNQVVNFAIGSITVCVTLYFLVKVNYLSEEATRKNQQEISHQNLALKKANAELDRFVYSASHDLRAPLTSILGLTNIARQTRDPKEIDQCLDMIASRVHRLDDFIRDIIDFSRNSRTQINADRVNITEMVDHVLDNLKHSSDGNPIHFEVDVHNELHWQTDPSRLQVIMTNLIGNAIKYADPRKENPIVKIHAAQSEGKYQLIVNDNGIGIPEEHQPRVFDMFYRASELSKGSGLGLFIVKETVDKLKGSIALRSHVGKGSTFTITLPVAEA